MPENYSSIQTDYCSACGKLKFEHSADCSAAEAEFLAFDKKIGKKWKAREIDPLVFKGVYPISEIERDREQAERMTHGTGTSRFDRTVIGEEWECELAEGIERFGWFGPGAVVRKTKQRGYDDAFGNDLVIFLPNEKKEHVRCSLDATTSSDDEVVINKRVRDMKEIKNGKLPVIKYLFDENGKPRGMTMPRVIVGARPRVVKRLEGLFMRDDKKLSDDVVQREIIEYMRGQLLWNIDFALRRHAVSPPNRIITAGRNHDEERAVLFQEIKRVRNALIAKPALRDIVSANYTLDQILSRILKQKNLPSGSGKEMFAMFDRDAMATVERLVG